MKKAIISFLVVCLLFSTMSLFVFASPDETTDIEYFNDGSYSIITLETISMTKGTVSKSKSYKYYNSNSILQWKATLTASFSYNGSTASCTSASASYTIYKDSWSNTLSTASKSGATATGNFTFKHYVLGICTKTVNKTLTLTCDKNGNVT